MGQDVAESHLSARGRGGVVDPDDAPVSGPVLVVEVHEHRVVRVELLHCFSFQWIRPSRCRSTMRAIHSAAASMRPLRREYGYHSNSDLGAIRVSVIAWERQYL